MSQYIGFDVGEKRVGVSVSDQSHKIALALGVVERQGGSYGFNKIKKLISDRNVEAFVVGIPLNMSGKHGIQSEKVLTYIEALKSYFHINVIPWDERYTTVIAESSLHDRNIPHKKAKDVIDAISAQLILQSYLDHINNQ
jgi:putative Holliday junction resolvase